MSSYGQLERRGFRVSCWIIVAMMAWLMPVPIVAQEPDPEEAREKSIVDRFVSVLEKNPRRGTALDKVYGVHVERGSLNGLIKTYRDKTASPKKQEAASAWMVVGLLESLRGQDASAVAAFEKAEQLDPSSYLASYYLGLSQVLIGQPDKAAEALERATQRKPAPADQLDVFQALGRVYQRAQKSDKALEVWNRLEKQFPNDARVQEQIATTLLEESEFASALPRFESLAKTTKDRYRQSLFQMEAAEIKVRLGKSADAIKEFEGLLSQLNPDNWLYREVRRRIENVYLRTDDQAGLISYYEEWMKKNPTDLGATSRLARLLAGLGRGAESREWLEKALKTAPTNKELRLVLIGQLQFEQKISDVIAQYEQFDKHEPNNPDILRDWGRAILKDSSRDEATRKKDAVAVWKRLTVAKPKDPLISLQVAELVRQVELTDEALALYQKAISLAPDAAQYKEYLGEYYHSLSRKDEAKATWRQIAEGNNKTAANVARLAEVLSSFGYLTEAIETNAEACKLDPKGINLQIKQVDLLTQAEKHDEALKQLEVVKKLAANDEEREAALIRELKELTAVDKLKERMASLHKELDETAGNVADGESKTAIVDRWFWLARAYEYERQLKEAAHAITKASELAPQSVPILMASGRIQESQNNLLAAVEINTKLAAIDRRYRTEYLKKVAQLELQLGRREKGIQAGRDLLAAAPGNPELYEFFSQLCFQLGETEEGLQALRRSVRVNPAEPKGLLLLAGALGDQFRTGEAIELYWRAFEKAATLDERLAIVPKLADLYLQTNQIDRLLERLERQRREPNQQREMTICLAQAYQSAGDFGNARQELEKLLTEETRDTQLLQQLVKLCETDGDLDMAVRYQQQLNKVVPGKEGIMRLAQLLTRSGEKEEATALMAQITAEEKDPAQIIKSIDGLLAQRQFEQALAIVRKLLRDQPTNWELLYREGAILAVSKPDEAASRFESILAMKLKDDELGIVAKTQSQKASVVPKGQVTTPQRAPVQLSSLQNRVQMVGNIRQVVNLDLRESYNSGQTQTYWTPVDYGQARLAAMAWQMKFAQTSGKLVDFVNTRNEILAKSNERRDLVDSYYLASLNSNPKGAYQNLKKLSLRPDADREMLQLYLYSLRDRGPAETPTAETPADASDPDDVADIDPDFDRNGNRIDIAPLDKLELDHVIDVAKRLASLTELNQYSWSMGTHLELVAAELKRSGRKAESRKLMSDAILNAKEPAEIYSVMLGTIQRDDYDTAIRLLDRLAELPVANTASSTSQGFNYAQYVSTPQYQSQLLGQLMANRARVKKLDDILGLWRRYLNQVATRNAAVPTPQSLAAKKQQRTMVQQQNVSPYFTIMYTNGQRRSEQIDFPSPNEIYDTYSIQMLRQAFALYRDADAVPKLIAEFVSAGKDDSQSVTQRQMWQFGLGYLYWWNDEKDEALSVLLDASRQLPDNNDFKFEIARLHEKRNEFAEALALIDALTPGDQAALQQREVMALRLSVNSGNVERARLAAERLFGLRLDSNLQMALARQMHQLGMHEQAEAVLARAGRQAGNRTEVLGSLMEQYASTGKNDVAIQIAHQLLRRSRPGGNSSQSSVMMSGGVVRTRNTGDDSAIRTQALQVMNRSGKLPEMIAKVESQLKTSPRSQRLLETLLEYYIAAGNNKKVDEINGRLAEFKADDPKFKYQLALKLIDSGKTKEANEHLKVVLEKEPSLIFNQYYELENKYRTQNKLEELVGLYESVDMKIFRQQPYVLSNLISNMSQQDKTRTIAMSLFKKTWAAIPESRGQLLSNMNDENFWKLPEIFDYIREGIIPTEAMLQQNRGLAYNGMSYGPDGKITTLNTRALEIATSQKKLDMLSDEIATAVKKMPSWDGGKILIGFINLRKGQVDEAKVLFEGLLPTLIRPTSNAQYYIYYTLREIGQELAAHEALSDLAIRYFEAAVANSQNDGNEFQYSAGKPLLELLKKRGRRDEARLVLINGMKSPNRSRNNPAYEAYRRIATAVSLGKEFQELGFPADAIKTYQRALSNSDDLVQASQYGGDQYASQLKTGLSQSLEALKPESLAELLAPPAKPTTSTTPTPSNTVSPASRVVRALRVSPNQAEAEPPVEDFTSIDLILSLDSPDLKKTRMASALVGLVTSLVSKPELLDKTTTALAEARAKRPDDWGAAILAAHIALASKEDTVRKVALSELVAMTERLPLEPLPEKGSMPAKLRVAALHQTQLWLVARECLKRGEDSSVGEKLATRSLEAARRLSDTGYALAILREWGQIAFEANDTKTAEQKWAEMLDLVIPKPGEKPKPIADPAAANASGTGRLSSTVSVLPMVPVRSTTALTTLVAANANVAAPLGVKGQAVTFAQFQKAAQIAMLAAGSGMADLSLRAIEQSLHAGPPLEAMQQVQPGNPFGGQSTVNDQSQSIVQVQQQLAVLEQIWRKNGVADDRIYATLRDTILPHGRPLEVFLYPQPLTNTRSQAPQSIGVLAVQAAVKANQADDLKQRLEARLGQPLGELTSRIALTQLALARQDMEAAAEHLALIDERIKLDSIVNTSDLACHAAFPALEFPELQPKAISILERATEHYFKNPQTVRNSQEEPIRSFRFKLADLHFRNGDIEAGKKHLASWVSQLGSMWSNYSGDIPQYRRRSEYLSAAAMYARYGLRHDSMEILGRYADITSTSNYGEQPIGLAGAVILNGIAQLAPEEQYSLLKIWSLPTADRRSVRVVGGLLAGDDAPDTFDAVRDETPRLSKQTQFLSNADFLVRSAATLGKLDELRSELEPFAADNVENARFLLLLTRVFQSNDVQIASDLQAWLKDCQAADAEAEKNPNNPRRSNQRDSLTTILAQAAVFHEGTQDVGRELCKYLLDRPFTHDQSHMAFIRHLSDSGILGTEQSSLIDRSPHDMIPMHWTMGTKSAASPTWWLTHEGKLQNRGGPGQSSLYLNFPLTGTFEVSCDVSSDGLHGSFEYGGITFHSLGTGQIFPTGRRSHAIAKPIEFNSRSRLNHVTIRVTPHAIQNFVNTALVHEEPIVATVGSPWFNLAAEGSTQTSFSNIRIDGQPIIPSEVLLSGSPTLLGWSSTFYNEVLPAHFKQDGLAPDRANQAAAEIDWSIVDGEIHGRKIPSASLGKTSVLQSQLQYGRPMRSGEQIDYEFWYEPGPSAIHVHPAFDRLAFLLEPDGVKLHWMTEFNNNPPLTKGLAADNSIVDADGRRGPAQLPLKSKDWNSVQIALVDKVVRLTLNGTLIFERPLEPENHRRFGFYHDKHATSVRVRNVVLKGDWPKTLSSEVLANLLFTSRELNRAEKQRISQLFDEQTEASMVDTVLTSTRRLPLEERYAALKNWVLPNDDHPSVRLYADHTPSDPLPGISTVLAPVSLGGKNGEVGKNVLVANQRSRTGGDLVAPALDLIVVAKELGKLNELLEAIQSIPDKNPLNRRSRLALQTLIAIAGNDSATAARGLAEMTPPRETGFSDEWPEHERWPELIVATESSLVPELRAATVGLLERVVDSVNRKGIGPAWETKVRSVRHRASHLLETGAEWPVASALSPKGQWAQRTLATAADRSHGIVPRWRFQGTEVTHLGGDGKDLIYFQSPLRGKFTVEGELSTFGWREATAMYGTHWAGPQYTLEAAGMGNLMADWIGPKFAKKLEPMGDWYRFKLEVTPEKAIWYANDELIHEQPLGDGDDPWLAIHSPGHYAAAVRSVRISGNPEIPTELQLSKRNDLQGWWGAMYGGSISGENSKWKKNGEEIVGTKLQGWNGRWRESLIQYHRPMLEDGEITYDFYYIPEQTLVHPTLGRMALVLDPDGVKIHWLTDAQYERGGVSPSNLYVERDHRRGPEKLNLKSRDWNKVSLRLQGDKMLLTLNGEVVYDRPLEAENQRTFGLFHFAGDTDVRVRNVVYRGDWPKTLPAPDQQELNR